MPVSSPSFPAHGYENMVAGIGAQGAMTGMVHTSDGDVSGWGNVLVTRTVGELAWVACAYLETLLGEARAGDVVTGRVAEDISALLDSVNRLTTTVDQVRSRQDQLAAALGLVEVPGWLTLDEVLHGDDMALARPSAESLGLQPDYFLQEDGVWTLQQGPPDDTSLTVASTEPAAGAVAKVGAVVKVFLA